MGWHCTITVIEGADLADLARVGWRVTDRTMAWDEASTSANQEVAAWAQGDRLVLTSGGPDLIDGTDQLATLGPVCAGLFQSVTDTYDWQAIGPDRRRRWMWSAYEQVLDEGEPHAEERGIEQLDEDALFLLLERVGGLRYDERLEEARFVVVEPSRPAPVSAPRKKRRWFG